MIKPLKIILVSIVLVTIFIFLMGSIFNRTAATPDTHLEPKSFYDFIKEIDSSIDKITLTSTSYSICSGCYTEIYTKIYLCYYEGLLGDTPAENTKNKEILEKKLFEVYSKTFIAFAKSALLSYSIDDGKVDHIKTEMANLKKSSLYSASGPLATEFVKIDKSVNLYKEMFTILNFRKSFAPPNAEYLRSNFPISNAKNIIKKAAKLLAEPNAGLYINQTRINSELIGIQNFIFTEHVTYLGDKVRHWSGRYTDYRSYSAYFSSLHLPIKNEIEALNSVVFNTNDFQVEEEYNKLERLWMMDNAKAANFPY